MKKGRRVISDKVTPPPPQHWQDTPQKNSWRKPWELSEELTLATYYQV